MAAGTGCPSHNLLDNHVLTRATMCSAAVGPLRYMGLIEYTEAKGKKLDPPATFIRMF